MRRHPEMLRRFAARNDGKKRNLPVVHQTMHPTTTPKPAAFHVLAVILLVVTVILASSTDCRAGKRTLRQWLTGEGEEVELPPGAELGEITHDGTKRTYYLYIPPSLKSKKSVPLVVAFHGGRQGSGMKFAEHTGLDALAGKEGFAVVYPDAVEFWNDGLSPKVETDDVGFTRTLIDHLVKTRGMDPNRIYATGAANGGIFAMRLACDAPDRIAAFAPVLASMPERYRDLCRPKTPVSIMMINGTEDPFVPWEGGYVSLGKGGDVIAVMETVDLWLHHNGCTDEPEVEELPDRDPEDGTRVEVLRYRGCRDDAAVVLVRINGGGHGWPGTPERPGRLRTSVIGRTSYDVDAARMIWDFFKGHRLR